MECMDIMVMETRALHIQRNSMRRLFLFITYLICTCHVSFSQSERWQVYPAYTEAVQVEAADNYLYCIMKGSGTINSNTGNLVRYDVEDGSVKTYDCLHELNDKEISRISYNEATGRLLVLYTTGNIDLLDADDNVVNISALSDASIYGERIKNISHIGKYVYLCLDFEIIEIDTELGSEAPNKLILDFGGVTFMDSSGIGLVMGRYKLAEEIEHINNNKSVDPAEERPTQWDDAVEV